MDYIHFELPWPPSVNNYWGQRIYKKRAIWYIKKHGKEFREKVREIISAKLDYCRDNFSSPNRLKVKLYISPPDKRKRDCDNLLKATYDALEHAGCFDNDEQIDIQHIVRDPTRVVKGGKIDIYINTIKGHEY